jgi:hypothetical protein
MWGDSADAGRSEHGRINGSADRSPLAYEGFTLNAEQKKGTRASI